MYVILILMRNLIPLIDSHALYEETILDFISSSFVSGEILMSWITQLLKFLANFRFKGWHLSLTVFGCNQSGYFI